MTTTPDYAGLIERLEKVEPDTPGEGVTRYYRNPDGPGAAAALRTLLESNAALEGYAREATIAITGLTAGGSEYFGKRIGEMYTADLPFCVERIRERMGYRMEQLRAEAERDRLKERVAELERERDEAMTEHTDMMWQRRRAEENAEAAEARLAALTGPEGDMRDYHEAIVASLISRAEAAEAKLAEAMKVIGQIDNALNDQFAAGIEEREGGSARRQERLMKSGEELRRAARKFLKGNGNGE